MTRDVMPGIPAAGHLTDRGYWHPGRGEGCVKCEDAKPRATICAGYGPDGRRCRKAGRWIVDGDPVCDWHRREYPRSRLPAKPVR